MGPTIFLLCLFGPVMTCWLVVWQLAEHFARAPRAKRALAWLHHGVAAIPLLWLATTATLVARAYLLVGEWPRRGRFEGLERGYVEGNLPPGALDAHIGLCAWLFLAMWLSMLVFPPLQAAVNGGFLHRRGWRWFAGWSLTWVFSVSMSFVDGPSCIWWWLE